MDVIKTELQNEKAKIEREYAEKMSEVLLKISKTYDISFKQLLRDVSVETTCSVFCLGMNKNQKPCVCRATYDGYCKRHKDQKPIVSAVKPSAQTSQHTHTLPPLFMAGCPVCEESARRRSIVALDI